MNVNERKVATLVDWLCATCGNFDRGATMSDVREKLNGVNNLGASETFDSATIEAAWERFERIAGKDRVFPRFDAEVGPRILRRDGTFSAGGL